MNENKYRTSSKVLIEDDPTELHTDKRMKLIASHIDGGKVLDVGCAHAILYRYYSPNIDYYGVDICKERVEFMNKNFKELNIILGDGEKLPYVNNTFDYVVIGEIIEHVENVMDFLKECYRVLRPKGMLIGSTPNPNELKRFVNGLFRMPYGNHQHINVFGGLELKNLMEGVGFKEYNWEFDKVVDLSIGKYRLRLDWLYYLFPYFSKCIIFRGVKQNINKR